MRPVFVILLIANLFFLAWAHWIDSPREGDRDALANLPRLKLVSETSQGSKPMSATPRNAEPEELPSTPDPGAEKVSLRLSEPEVDCTSLGPFSDITSAARAAGLLVQRGFRLSQRAEEGETIEGYWVYVGGMQSDDEVSGVVERLAKSGFTDAHVMKNYSTNRRVSVGMFSTHERAEKRAAAVRNMGLQPEIGERRFPGTVYWVDVSVSRVPGAGKSPAENTFTGIGGGKVGTQRCPVPVRPAMPTMPESMPGDDDGIIRRLPRTTVASAPKTLP